MLFIKYLDTKMNPKFEEIKLEDDDFNNTTKNKVKPKKEGFFSKLFSKKT